MTIRYCSEDCLWEGCMDPAACDDGTCSFCGADDCDGSGYHCEDQIVEEYNLHDERPYAFDEDEAEVP
jgi:hypothetical protein